MPQDYNKTINLPKTDFPMRAALAKREPGMLEKMYEDDIYNKLMEKNEGKPLYVLHDGPPYAKRRYPHRPRAEQDPQGFYRSL